MMNDDGAGGMKSTVLATISCKTRCFCIFPFAVPPYVLPSSDHCFN